MKISKIRAREIFDSRARPTLFCEVELTNGVKVGASVPSGASKGEKEAFELRDKGEIRFGGKGVTKAVHIIENTIAPVLLGQEPDVVVVDNLMQQMDSSADKTIFGANTMLAVSMAVCKAQAKIHSMELFELIAELCSAETVSLPFPLINIINGGAHSNNKIPIQEFLLAPMGFQNFRSAFEASIDVFYALKEILQKKNKSVATGDEGGFSPFFSDEQEPFDYIMEALHSVRMQDNFSLAIDVAAGQLYDQEKNMYNWSNDQKITSDELIEKYKTWSLSYPLFSVEDGCSEYDMQGWKTMAYLLGDSLQIVGDDIFATHKNAIERGIKDGIANACIIKPNQIGTISETLETIAFCQQNNVNAIVSHRSGETEDSFIADLAVGVGAGQIKAGGLFHGERMAKYNRLLQIEDELLFSSLDF